MKKILLTIISIISITILTKAQNDTIYFMKDGNIILQHSINPNDIDSVVFYAPREPILETMQPHSITETSAICGGTIIKQGGDVITQKGINWSTDSTFNSSVQTLTTSSQENPYSVTMSNLAGSTKYYVRAFAVNSHGTGYGDVLSFTTGIYDGDGNLYQLVTIGSQVWFKENLKTTKYSDGTDIPNVTDATQWNGLTTGAYCWYNNDSDTYANTYGALYNWYAVDTDKLCPTGWHVPSNTEWVTLFDQFGRNELSYILNDTIFNATFSGAKEVNFGFGGMSTSGSYWSITEIDTQKAYYQSILPNFLYKNAIDEKDSYYSVRCIKD